MALLSSDEFQKKQNEKQDGFNPSGQQTSYTGKIRCIGYPFGIDGQDLKEHLTAHGTEILGKRLTPKARMELQKRKSPRTSIPVLRIEGEIVHGFSGAPILNDKNEVIGVADGGLQIGSEISWAIPFDQIIWTDASGQHMVAEMKRIEPLPAFALSSLTLQISRSKTLMLQQMRSDEMMDWYAAQEYAEKMNRESLEGYSDWRLPAVGELQELAKFIKSSPGSYSDIDMPYWSSEHPGSSHWDSDIWYAFAVNLGDRGTKDGIAKKRGIEFRKEKKIAVRLVRNI